MYLLVDGDYFLSGFAPGSEDAVKAAVERLLAAVEEQLLRPSSGGSVASAVDARLIFFSSALLDGLAAEARSCVISSLRRHRFQTHILESIRGRAGTPVDAALCTKILQLGVLPSAGGVNNVGGGGGGMGAPRHTFCLVTHNAYLATALELLVSRECGEVVFVVYEGDELAEALLGYASARYGASGGVATMPKEDGVTYVPDTTSAIAALEQVQQQQRGRLPLSTLTELKCLQAKLQQENQTSTTGATVSMPPATKPSSAVLPQVNGHTAAAPVPPPLPGVTDLFGDPHGAQAPSAAAPQQPPRQPSQPPTAPPCTSSADDSESDVDDESAMSHDHNVAPPPKVPSTFVPMERVNVPQEAPLPQPSTNGGGGSNNSSVAHSAATSFFAVGPSRIVSTATSPPAVVQLASPPSAQPPPLLVPPVGAAAGVAGEPQVSTLLPAEWALVYDAARQRHYYASVDSTGRPHSTWQHPLGYEKQRELEEKAQAWRLAQASASAAQVLSPSPPQQQQQQQPANYVLPEGWEQRVDQRTGRTFYVNHITRTTSWTPPSMASSLASSVNPAPVPSVQPHVPAMPEGGADEWESRVDPASGRTFYVNHRTKQTSWTRPVAAAAPAPAPAPAMPPAQPPALPPMWEARVDQNSGRTYYINHATKSTTWERPLY